MGEKVRLPITKGEVYANNKKVATLIGGAIILDKPYNFCPADSKPKKHRNNTFT